jgi:pyruvate dehydrogenase E2 component (dihydrolipoamide acetyltransferase)
MATYLTVPKLGMALANATVVEWKVTEGERVDKSQPVVTIETQKTKFDMEAEEAGFVHILVPPDTEVAVGRVVGAVAASPEELTALQQQPIREISVPAPGASGPTGPAVAPAAARSAPARNDDGGHIRISPVARKLAEEHMIDVARVAGTGPEGRIVREDIEKALAAREAGAAPGGFDGRRVAAAFPLKGMRKAIAEHMQRSLAVSAQLTAMGEIDASELMKRRKEITAQPDTAGMRISLTDMIVFTLARALKEFPKVNSSLMDNEIKVWESVNIGVAVALDDGLIVPVVKEADRKSLGDISHAVAGLAAKAREGRLVPEEVTGGTFTLTNLGAAGAGWRFETAIINQPESAILGTGGITERAVVRDGQIVIRPMMTYSFTYDHRVIDGSLAVKFMARVIELLESAVHLKA